MKVPFRKSLRAKILISTLLGTFAFSGLLYLSLTFLAQDTIMETARQTEKELFSRNMRFLRYWFAERSREVLYLSKVETVRSMDLGRIHTYLKNDLPSRDGPMLQYIAADSQGRYTTSFVPDAGSLSLREYFHRVMRGETIVSEAVQSLSTGLPIIVIASPVFGPNQEVSGLFGVTLDLTAFHEYFSDILQAMPDDLLMMVDSQGRILFHSQSAAIGTYTILEPSDLILPDIVQTAPDILKEQNGEIFNDQIHLFHAVIDGTPGFRFMTFHRGSKLDSLVGDLQRRLLIISILLLIAASIAIIIISRIWTRHLFLLKEIFDKASSGDLSVIAPENGDHEMGLVSHSFNHMMRTIRSITFYDPVTSLPNRAYFEDFVRKSLNTEMAVGFSAVIVLSVDKFKNFNDTHGGSVGDELLRQIGKRLIRILSTGAMISRGNGAEYNIFIAHSANRSQILTGVDTILKDSGNPFTFGEEKYYVTYSAGIAFFPTDANHFDDLMIHASIAKNAAKKTGGNTYKTFNDSMKLGLSRQMQIEAHLHIALEFGQFHLVYQPQVDAFSQEITGMEALLRWNSPELGSIPPNVFIPIAEESGLIRQIGIWVMETACRQNKAWVDAGYKKVPVAVNVSSLQFDQPGFLDEVARVLESTGLPAHLLELEITERIAMGAIEDTLVKLRAIDAMGIKISVDDFGTGYSSLNYFKDFPIHALKIDQSFIKEIPNDPNTMAIVETVITMGRNFQVEIIAEGVETQEQFAFIQYNGCKKVQGYYFSKPLSREDMGECLRLGKIGPKKEEPPNKD